jgi:hypothetical protein
LNLAAKNTWDFCIAFVVNTGAEPCQVSFHFIPDRQLQVKTMLMTPIDDWKVKIIEPFQSLLYERSLINTLGSPPQSKRLLSFSPKWGIADLFMLPADWILERITYGFFCKKNICGDYTRNTEPAFG